MFKVGDKIVCNNNIILLDIEIPELEIGKIYIVGRVVSNSHDMIFLKDCHQMMWSSNRFISIKEFRKQKLEKLNKTCSK